MLMNTVCAADAARVASQIRPSNILDNKMWGRAAGVGLGVVETLKTLEIREEDSPLRLIA